MYFHVRDPVDDITENQVHDPTEKPDHGNSEAQEEHDEEVEPKNNKKGGMPRKKEKIIGGSECDVKGDKFLTTLNLNLFALQ